MSLESLFKDRKIRESIRNTVNEAKDVGKGECDVCSEEGYLLNVYGYNVCENCYRKIEESAEDYERLFTEEPKSVKDILLLEGYVIPDMKKLEADAKAKFNGSIPDLMKSYGMNPHKDWDDRIQSGRIYIRDNEISGGKTRVNQFLIDYDCSFLQANAAKKLVPDKDGTFAPLKVNGKPVQQAPAPAVQNNAGSVSTPAVAKQSATKAVSNIPIGPGIKAVGDKDKFTVDLISKPQKVSIQCERTNKSSGNKVEFDVSVQGAQNASCKIMVEDGDEKAVSKAIVEKIKEEPNILFSAFDEEDMKNGFSIAKYSAYAFKFDDKSFDGNNISLILTLNGKPFEKSRVPLSAQALFKRNVLETELRRFMDYRLRNVYPCLFDGTLDVRTSLGKAVTEFVSVETSDKDKRGMVKLSTNLGNASFVWNAGGSRFTDKEVSKNSVLDVIYMNMGKFIPGWDDNSIKTPSSEGNDSYTIDNLTFEGRKCKATASFKLNTLYDTGNIVMYLTVEDTLSGNKEEREIIYSKSGTKLKDFILKETEKVMKETFNKSDMVLSITKSAQDKLKNSSKREAFLYKVGSLLIERLSEKDPTFRDVSCKIEKFEVNNANKVTNCVLRFYDNGDIASSSSDLSDLLSLKSIPFIKVDLEDDSEKSLDNYGYSVVCSVSDMEEFSNLIHLTILESLIQEFLTTEDISEGISNRKKIYV